MLHKDKHIRRRSTELAALKNACVAAFVLTSGSLTGEEMAVAFVKALKRMTHLATHEPRPFIATVARDGRVKILLTARDLKKKW